MNKVTILNVSIVLGLTLASTGTQASNEDQVKEKPAKNAPAQHVDPLKEALASSYTTNSALRAKLHELYAIDEDVNLAFSEFRPSLSVIGDVGQNAADHKATRKVTDVSIPNRDGDPDYVSGRINKQTKSKNNLTKGTATLQLEQSLYKGGSTLANLRAQENAAFAGQYGLLFVEQDTLQKAITAYMDVIFQTSSVKSRETNVKFLTEQLDVVKSQVKFGEKAETDTAVAESALAKAEAELLTNMNELDDAKANYLNIIGEKPGLLEYPPSLPKLPKTLNEVIDVALKSNPKILEAIYKAKKEDLLIDARSGALLPSLDLTASASRNLNRDRLNSRSNEQNYNRAFANQFNSEKGVNKGRNNDAAVDLKLTVPLYGRGGADYALTRRQAESAAAARYELEQARKNALENATKAWDTLKTARANVIGYKKQLDAAEKARNGALVEVKAGARNFLDLVELQVQLINAGISLQRARRDEVVAQYTLLAVMGKLTARDLGLPVTIYDVDGHLDKVRYKMIGFGDAPKILEDKEDSGSIIKN